MPYRPTEKTKANKAAKTESVIQAAINIVSESGFSGLKMSHVAKQAGVATGTVYKYFPSKNELAQEVFKRTTIREVELVNELANLGDTSSSSKRLMNSIDVFAKRALKGQRLAYALIAEPVDPLVEKERLVYRKAYSDIYSELIKEGIELGEFREQDATVSAAAMVGALAESLVGPLSEDLNLSTPQKQKELIRSIQEYCLSALL